MTSNCNIYNAQGAKEEVRIARTADGELLVTANKLKVAGKLEAASLKVLGRSKNGRMILFFECKNKLTSNTCKPDGSGGGKEFETRLGAVEKSLKLDSKGMQLCV